MKLLFKKYYHSVLDPEEFSVLEDYLGKEKNEKEITQVMKASWREIMEEAIERPEGNPALLERIQHAIQVDKHRRAQRKLKRYTWGLRAAAVLVVALIASGIFYLQTEKERLGQQFHSISTPFGSKTKIALPDGTFIWLNAGSNIRYSNDFGIHNRVVHLSGEAFFEVFHHASLQFSVETSELTIKSYGTAFNVKTYPEEGTIETTLIEGSIGISRSSSAKKGKDEVLLEPNERVVYFRKSKSMETSETKETTAETPKDQAPSLQGSAKQKTTYLISKGIDTGKYTSWKEGTITIRSETLRDLAVKLERKYDVRIHFESEALKSLRISGSLENETVEQVIDAIGMAAQIDYEIEDRDIWIKERSK
jgi:ferric-dicitrate binding protein FerR (iron transport regulator)